jgi:hypothetical protein
MFFKGIAARRLEHGAVFSIFDLLPCKVCNKIVKVKLPGKNVLTKTLKNAII